VRSAEDGTREPGVRLGGRRTTSREGGAVPEGDAQRSPRRADEPRGAARRSCSALRPHGRDPYPQPTDRPEHARGRHAGEPRGPLPARRAAPSTTATPRSTSRRRRTATGSSSSRAICCCRASSSSAASSTSTPSSRSCRCRSTRGICCHVGGKIDFDGDGNLYLSTGDDTNPFQSSGFTPIDERDTRNPAFDAQRTSANTNDLRGKILRIRVTSGGDYSVPAGNLFRPGTPRTRLEIYAMGFRNPFRMSVDKVSNNVYVGDYSPDADEADPNPEVWYTYPDSDDGQFTELLEDRGGDGIGPMGGPAYDFRGNSRSDQVAASVRGPSTLLRVDAGLREGVRAQPPEREPARADPQPVPGRRPWRHPGQPDGHGVRS
jgi:Glucose / Sorbosone dehydrogenase